MGADARAGLLGAPAACPHAAALAAGRGLAALGTSAVGRGCDPCEVPVAPDRGVVAIDEDDLVVLQFPVLPDPVGVEHLHVRELPGRALFCDPLDGLAGREPVLAHPGRAACPDVTGRPAAAAADLDACDGDALLGLVAERAGAVDAGGALDPDDAPFAPPYLHPVPEEFCDLRLVRSLPCLPDEGVHRFYHGDHLRFGPKRATFLSTGRIPCACIHRMGGVLKDVRVKGLCT